MNIKQRVNGGLSGPQSASKTCSIAGACYWMAVGNFVSRSVALAI